MKKFWLTVLTIFAILVTNIPNALIAPQAQPALAAVPGAPAAPTGLAATIASASQVDLAWTDNSDNETGFNVERSLNNFATAPSANFTASTNQTTFSDNTVALGNTYAYRVIAVNSLGDSDPSNVASVLVQALAAPANLTASLFSATQVDLTWTDNSTNEFSFRIERAPSAIAAFVPVGQVLPGVTAFSDTSVTLGNTYYYKVIAVNPAGDSAPSNVLPIKVAVPDAPSDLHAIIMSATKVDLIWTDQSNNEASFRIERSLDNFSTAPSANFTVALNQRTYSDNTVAATNTYSYRIIAVNVIGDSAPSNTATAIVTGKFQAGPIDPATVYPAAPAGVATGSPGYYQDDQGTRVSLRPITGNGLTAPTQIFDNPVLTNPYSVFLGYGSEAFYWMASTVSPTSVGQMRTVFGIEAAFGGVGDAAPGQEFVFVRTRIVADVPFAGTYIFQHPYGTVTIPVTAADVAAGGIFYTSDMGVQRDFLAAASPNNGNVSRFLRPVTPAPAGWLGTGVVGLATGSPLPTPFNKVRLTGPAGSDLGGPGIDFVETDQFSVNGRLFSTVTPSFTTTLDPANGVAPVTVTFTNTTTGNITAWAWDFGDGTTSTLQNPPPKTYTTPGIYTISLAATDNTSAVGTTSRTVNVFGPLVAGFTKSLASGVAPLAVTFTDTSTGVPTTWLWDFGDNTTSTLQNPTKTYTVAGTYTVTLTVTNAGSTSSTSQTVTVTAPVAPVASFTMSATTGVAPLTVTFTDTSTGVPTSWSWDFGDGSAVSTLQNPSHIFTAAGTFTVTLTATNALGPSSASQTVTVTAAAPVVPTAPTGLTATRIEFNRVDLTWTDNANNETGFNVERSTDNVTFALVSTEAVNATTFSDRTVSPGTSYLYRVSAVNAAGASAPASPITVFTPVANTGGGGGGDGGGVPGPVALTGITGVTPTVDAAGTTIAAAALKTADGKAAINIGAGTKISNKLGQIVNTLAAAPLATPPAPPPTNSIVLAYTFGPTGTQFNPPINVSLTFDPATLPPGTQVNKLFVAFWDGTQWTKLNSTVDAATNTITAQVAHFTEFAIMAEKEVPPPPAPPAPALAPAQFAISNLSIAPPTVKAGESVTISARVSNNGGSPGKIQVVLKIDGVKEASQDISLNAGANQTVSFPVKKAAGTYTVGLEGLGGQFTVTPAAAAPVTSPATTRSTAAGVTSPGSGAIPEPAHPIMLSIGFVVLAAAGGLSLVYIFRRKKT